MSLLNGKLHSSSQHRHRGGHVLWDVPNNTSPRNVEWRTDHGPREGPLHLGEDWDKGDGSGDIASVKAGGGEPWRFPRKQWMDLDEKYLGNWYLGVSVIWYGSNGFRWTLGPWRRRVLYRGAFILCLVVGWFVRQQDSARTSERISRKLGGRTGRVPRLKPRHLGSDMNRFTDFQGKNPWLLFGLSTYHSSAMEIMIWMASALSCWLSIKTLLTLRGLLVLGGRMRSTDWHHTLMSVRCLTVNNWEQIQIPPVHRVMEVFSVERWGGYMLIQETWDELINGGRRTERRL